MKYIAVDSPDYDVLKGVEPQHEMTDEAYGMAYKQVKARNATYENACDTMADHLQKISAFDHTMRTNESVMYQAAALIFRNAPRAEHPRELAIRLGGRVYEVKEQG